MVGETTMTRLPSLCLLLAALAVSSSLAAPSRVIEVAIGEPREVHIPADAQISGPIDEPLPSWIVRNGKVLQMIAPPDALPKNLVVIGKHTLDIVVKENEPTSCDRDEWAQLVIDEEPLKLWPFLKDLEALQGVSLNDIRVVPRAYAYSYRQLEEEDDLDQKGDTVVIVKSECGKSVNHIVETLYEKNEQVSITHGSIPSRSSRNEDANSILSSLSKTSTDEPIGEELDLKKETTTLASTTTTRQTRATAIAYAKIKSIECKQGSFCVGELDDKTFMAGDGGVTTFDLTIELLSSVGGVNPWVMKEGKKRLIGVIPLTAGEHTFRLRGIEKKTKKHLTAPFSIIVKEDAPINHQFKMSMFSLPSEPEYLRTTIVKLASFLKRNPDEIKVANFSTAEGSKFVTYWNTSLPTTSCPTKEVAQWLRGLHIKQGQETNNDFAKAFNNHPTIHPSRLEIQWIGKCESAGAAAAADGGVMTAGGVGGVKQGEEPTAEETTGSLSTLITIVCVLALILAVLIAIFCCFFCRRSKSHNCGVNEYMSKGSPVVFPDEVEDEHADIPASAPMLVKEERPPLRVSEHSNPLYKPPPPLASTAASPRPTAPSAHKLPPPYVPP